jgi:hypothetical protein
MHGREIETADRRREGTGGERLTGNLVELILAASDESEDLWEIGDRLDAMLRSDGVSASSVA